MEGVVGGGVSGGSGRGGGVGCWGGGVNRGGGMGRRRRQLGRNALDVVAGTFTAAAAAADVHNDVYTLLRLLLQCTHLLLGAAGKC